MIGETIASVLAGLAVVVVILSCLFALTYNVQQDKVKKLQTLELCIGPVKEATYQHRLACIEQLKGKK